MFGLGSGCPGFLLVQDMILNLRHMIDVMKNYELCFDNLAMRDKYIKKMNQTSNTIYNNITHIFH